MRTTKLQLQISVDGYMAGPDGEMDWLTGPWTDDVNTYVDGIWKDVDTIVLGRKLAEGFIPAWEAGPEGEDQASIDAASASRPGTTPRSPAGTSPRSWAASRPTAAATSWWPAAARWSGA